MDVRHEQIVIADGGEHPTAFGAAVDCGKFADLIAVSDAGLGTLAVVLQILGCDADGGVGIELVVVADRERALQHDAGFNAGACADFDVGADDDVGSDLG